MKKGRHRRFEEARALKRSPDINLDELFESLRTDDAAKPGGGAWQEADDELADEYDDDELDDDDDDVDR